MIRLFFQTVLRVLRRPIVWLLVWTYRDVIALWGRSFKRELRRPGGTDGERLTELVRGLWASTRGTGLAVRVNPPAGTPIAVETHEVVAVVDAPPGVPGDLLDSPHLAGA